MTQNLPKVHAGKAKYIQTLVWYDEPLVAAFRKETGELLVGVAEAVESFEGLSAEAYPFVFAPVPTELWEAFKNNEADLFDFFEEADVHYYMNWGSEDGTDDFDLYFIEPNEELLPSIGTGIDFLTYDLVDELK